MNFLRISLRNMSSFNGKYFVQKLVHRDIIRVCGTDVLQFLQGLITNDMNHLNTGAESMYTMFLNKTGKVLYDSIIFKTIQPDTFLIECDKEISGDLRRHLRLFRVRRKIDVDSVGDDYAAWVMFSMEANPALLDLPEKSVDVLCSIDPRLKLLGFRLIIPNSFCVNDISKLFPNEIELTCSTDGTNDYQLLRYKLGVGEGVVDHPPAKCFPLEANCDYLHGVSFHKGCYIGQELTARVHHTGTIRKRLMPVKLSKNLTEPMENVQLTNGTNVGIIRGIKGKAGLALIRMEQAFRANELLVNHEKVELVKPEWWPIEMPHKVAASNTTENFID